MDIDSLSLAFLYIYHIFLCHFPFYTLLSSSVYLHSYPLSLASSLPLSPLVSLPPLSLALSPSSLSLHLSLSLLSLFILLSLLSSSFSLPPLSLHQSLPPISLHPSLSPVSLFPFCVHIRCCKPIHRALQPNPFSTALSFVLCFLPLSPSPSPSLSVLFSGWGWRGNAMQRERTGARLSPISVRENTEVHTGLGYTSLSLLAHTRTHTYTLHTV